MAGSTAKENILKKIRQALAQPVPLPFPNSEGRQDIYHKNDEDEAIVFAEAFTRLQGKFAFCTDHNDLASQLGKLIHEKGWTNIFCTEAEFYPVLTALSVTPYDNLADCDAAITGCEYLTARTGSIVLSSANKSGRTASVYAPIHICIAYNRQLVYDIKDALSFLKEKYKDNFPSMISFATGPSRTADIEKTLVTGVHGPKEVYCFLIEG
jgi:L-lactate dehydrogenase complex protein LldG